MKKVQRPKCLPPVTDGLVFTLAWAMSPTDKPDERLEKIRLKLESAIEDERCERSFPRRSRFRLNFRILLADGGVVNVGIGALDRVRQKGSIRVKLNPAKLTPGGIEQMHSVMLHLVGPEYTELLANPRINCWDIAVDIRHASLDHMLIQYNHAEQHTIFGKRMSGTKIETYNFGSATSDYFSAVYDKSAERRDHALKRLLNSSGRDAVVEPLNSYLLKQLKSGFDSPPVVRVEVRGRKLQGKHPSELKNLSNRFKWFKFADLQQSGTELPTLTEKAFLAMCRQEGVKAAFDAFKHSKKARAVHAYWRSRRADWWKPDDIWEQAYAELESSGIFPAAAFEPLNPAAAVKLRRGVQKRPVRLRRRRAV